ncbi:MAG: hypothetical protein K2L95_03030 [Alphaproteobacteria bacterium]|nr:hypothetical protein [Alphaproteobacteria bacterium]MDE6571165.1 hypothetical protein [Alphaproteobacteria bacterium]
MKIKISKLFDWSVASITEPVPVFQPGRDQAQMLKGYELTVTYVHHGTEKCMFSVDGEKFKLATPEYALYRARGFYNHVKKQMAAQHQKQK